MIRLHTRRTWYDADSMSYAEAASIHASRQGMFDVRAKEFGHHQFRRMSIAADEVVRVEEVP